MIELIQQRLDTDNSANPIEEEQARKEILQEVALYALWRTDFFQVAAFQGGTSLRILHRLPRFSEDLDFILKKPSAGFTWNSYLEPMLDGLREFGLHSELIDKSNMDRNMREAMLKDDSILQQLGLSFYGERSRRTLKIKLEIDVNPPKGSEYEYTYLDFPLDYEVCHQDLGSNFALKIHALLCRPYLKGRDWFDFNWYVKMKVMPNLTHLRHALFQYGPWKNKRITFDQDWLSETLLQKIASIDWGKARDDVQRFLNSAEQQSLSLWSVMFFTKKVEQLHASASTTHTKK